MCNELKCSFCGREFSNVGARSCHEKRWCKNNPDRKPIDNLYPLLHTSKPGGWECECCHQLFRIRNDLEAHLKEFPNHKAYKRRRINKWVCKICGSIFRVRSELHSHINETGHKIIPHQHKELCTCKYCGKEWLVTICGYHNHENHCIANPNRFVIVGHPHTDESKKLISEKRKEYLAAHPDEHVWKRHTKFTSVPCNDLKEFLRAHNYSFIEEASIIPNRNFAVDICFPDKKLVVEVNGNQHYDTTTMELGSYYKERHDLIESYGWCVIEVPYNKSYTEEFRSSLCNLLDDTTADDSVFNYKFDCIGIHECARCRREEYTKKIEESSINGTLNKNGKLSGNKVSIDELNRRKDLILNSGIDLTKLGWVNKVAEITGLSKRVIYLTVNSFDDLKSKVFRRDS